MNRFLFFFLLQANLLVTSCGVKFNPTIAGNREVHPMAANFKDVKMEVIEVKVMEESEMNYESEDFIIKEEPVDEVETGENGFNQAILDEGGVVAVKKSLEIVDGDPDWFRLSPKIEVEEPTLSNREIGENMTDENEMNSECEEFKGFIIKEEAADEVATGSNYYIQKILDERRIEGGEKSMLKGRRILTHVCKNKPHKCEECGRSFSQIDTLSKHRFIHGEEKLHKCNECGKSFPRKYSLSKHILIHTGEKPHNCEKCGKSFSIKSSLSKHNLTHTGEKPHNCNECGKSFSQKNNLFKHILVHRGERPHNCKECGKCFSQKSNLAQHIFTHTREKPYNCKECGKSFSQKRNLSQHIIAHSGERPHNCKECGKSFSRKRNLSQHILIHTVEKPHKCEVCGKSFSEKRNFSQHILTHTGYKPHNCVECGKSFFAKGSLSRHIRTLHKIYDTSE